MHLKNDEISHFHTNGFVAGPRVLDNQQIEILKQEINGLLDGSVEHPEHLRGETVKRSRAKGQLPSQKIVNLFRNNAVFAKLLENTTISNLATDLAGESVRVWEDQMIFKPPHEPEAVLAWHRDYTFWDHVGPPKLFTCWIALDDATVENGCMHVIPGSHLWEMPFRREDVDVGNPHWILEHNSIPQGADTSAVPCVVKAGHCHFHHCNTLHGSYGNLTDNPRYSYILHLMPGTTRRLGDSWNDRMARVENVGIGQFLKGSQYPELGKKGVA